MEAAHNMCVLLYLRPWLLLRLLLRLRSLLGSLRGRSLSRLRSLLGSLRTRSLSRLRERSLRRSLSADLDRDRDLEPRWRLRLPEALAAASWALPLDEGVDTCGWRGSHDHRDGACTWSMHACFRLTLHAVHCMSASNCLTAATVVTAAALATCMLGIKDCPGEKCRAHPTPPPREVARSVVCGIGR